jgi:hypothetical protein
MEIEPGISQYEAGVLNHTNTTSVNGFYREELNWINTLTPTALKICFNITIPPSPTPFK